MAAAVLQQNVNSTIIIAPELVGFGDAALTNAGRAMRRVSTTLALAKDAFTSAEARPDQQVATARHGGLNPGGTIEGELVNNDYDDVIEAIMRGTWAAGVSLSQTELTSVAADSALSKFVFAAGDPLALGLKTGDMILLSDTSEAANSGVNFRITGFGGTSNRDVSVSPAPVTQAADTTFTLAVRGKKCAFGTARRSFSLELVHPDIDLSELYTGARFGGMQVRVPPSGISTVGFEVMARNREILKAGNSPYFISPAAASASEAMAGPDGAVRIGGVEMGIVTGFDLSVNLGLSSSPVVGSKFKPDIFYGVSRVSGNVSAFLQDATLLEAFQNETELDLVLVLDAPGADPQGFLSFNVQRTKLMGESKSIAAEGGVIVSFPFQGLLKTGGAGTAYDQTSMVIQRSNS